MSLNASCDLSVIIPAYNEEERLPATLQRLQAHFAGGERRVEIVVVDDGSTDATAAVAERPTARTDGATQRVLRNARNRGKGYSVRHGMLAARGERLLLSDADLSAPIAELAKLEAALDAGADIAIGSRARRELLGIRQNRLREQAGRCFNGMVRLTLDLPFHDTQCGFKLFRRPAAQIVFARQTIEGWGFDPELLFIARRFRLDVREIPVAWSHAEGAKIRLLRDSGRMFADLARIRRNARQGRYGEASEAIVESAGAPRRASG